MADFAVVDVPGILTGIGWSPRGIDERTWRCTVPTAGGDARIVVRHAGTWLYLAVIPFLDPESIRPWGAGKFPPRFLGRILAVNNNLVLVKFALDEDGDLSLRVELPTESLQRREVETAAQMLLRTTEQYRGPIREALLEAHRASLEPPPQKATLDVANPGPPENKSQGPTAPVEVTLKEGELPPIRTTTSDPPTLLLSDSIPAPASESGRPPPSDEPHGH